MRGWRWTTVIAVGLVAFGGGVPAAGAAAHPRTHPSGRALGLVPHGAGRAPSLVALTSPPLDYHGGAVIHGMTVRTIFWEPSGHAFPDDANTATGYKALVNRFYTDVAHDSGKTTNPYASVVQYPDGTGPALYRSTFAGSFTTTAPLPADGCSDPLLSGNPCLSDAQLTGEIANVMAAHGLAPKDGDYYALYLGPNIVDCAPDTGGPAQCSSNVYCAYHSSFTEGANPANVLWANEPYPDPVGCGTGATPNGNQLADDIIDTSSHEQNETVTDPFADGWWVDDPGGKTDGFENGDLCNFDFGLPLGGSGTTRWNSVINGNNYWIQREWSNDGLACVTTYADPIAGTFTTSPAANAEAGQQVGFSASTADGLGAISIYRWAFGDGSGTESSAANTTTHAFATPGTYHVFLTAADSTRAGGSDQFVTIRPGPSAAFTAPSSLPSGSAATFDGGGSSSSSAISTYSWTFGDGQSVSGAAAMTSHAYAHPGTYTVTLAVTDAVGLSASVQHSVTVTNRAPTAVATASAASVGAGSPVTFNGRGSSDPDGTIASYLWSFGDGTSASGSSVSHTYHAGGSFTATLTVRDNNGATDTATVVVHVAPPPPCVVPSLQGLTLSKARKRLSSAHCTLGHVGHAHSAKVAAGHVLRSSPARATHRAHGARVSVTISSGP
jgi:PKD repeat protein